MQRISRRVFLRDVGRGTLGLAVVGLAACSNGDGEATADTAASSLATTATSLAAASTTTTSTGKASTEAPDAGTLESTAAPVAWERVSLGFVSAYVLVRNDLAAVVDTGVDGSAGAIEEALSAVGLSWEAVGHVILTHLHPDHVGSLRDVLVAAPDAVAYAGAEDIPSISSPRPITAVGDGDDVFGLRIIATPGHTAGHISVLDPAGGLLVAGDALNGADGGGVTGVNPRFTDDVDTADDSIRKLATLRFDTVVFGHGEPVEGNASDQVAALAASL